MIKQFSLAAVVGALLVSEVCAPTAFADPDQKATAPTDGEHKVVFTGGHDTVGEDRGRPVILIASALGVKPQVFRDVFKGVHPAGPGSGGPTHQEAQANKKVLLDGLAKYGITNERLDEVSNYYRYRRQNGELWKHRDASAVAIVKDGKVTGFNIIDAGAGYSSPPTVAIEGADSSSISVDVSYGKDLATNGSIIRIAANSPSTQPR